MLDVHINNPILERNLSSCNSPKKNNTVLHLFPLSLSTKLNEFVRLFEYEANAALFCKCFIGNCTTFKIWLSNHCDGKRCLQVEVAGQQVKICGWHLMAPKRAPSTTALRTMRECLVCQIDHSDSFTSSILFTHLYNITITPLTKKQTWNGIK